MSSPDSPVSSGISALPYSHPSVAARAVTDPAVRDAERLFQEAVLQATPFAAPGERTLSAHVLLDGTALPRGLRMETAMRQVSDATPLEGLIRGANRPGKAAEIVAANEYRAFENGGAHRLVNAPARPSPSVIDVRLSPDSSSKRDLLFKIRTKAGGTLWGKGGQVKTGDAEYITKKLVKMTRSNGYGKVGIVDARFVGADGRPVVGDGAFTAGQARRLEEAGVRLRGVDDLGGRSCRLVESIDAYGDTGLTPLQEAKLTHLRDDIARAYRGRGIAGRVAGGAAVGFATGAVLSLVMQKMSGGEIDVVTLAEAGGQAAVFGGGTAAADGVFYHAATTFLGQSPEAAKALAQKGVAGGLCLLAVATDVYSEVREVRAGTRTVADAVRGGSAKAALDLLPLVVAPLGLAGIPVLIAAQSGGRLMIGRLRARDAALTEAFEADQSAAAESLNRARSASRDVATALRSNEAVAHRVSAVLPTHSSPSMAAGDIDALVARTLSPSLT